MLSDVWTILSTIGSLIAAFASIMAIVVSMLFRRRPSAELDMLGKVSANLVDILAEVENAVWRWRHVSRIAEKGGHLRISGEGELPN